VVIPRDEQGVTWEQGPVVEEGDGPLVLEDDVCRLIPRNDLTEPAVRVLGGHGRDTVKARRGGENA
jgi:hypothetical protein